MDETVKMIIKGFDDPKFDTPTDVEPFKVHVNPESYTQSVDLGYSGMQEPGSSGKASKYNHTDVQTQSFDLLLDRTGALGNEPDKESGIYGDIDHFKKLAVDYSGKIHKPRYLIISWGTLNFKCQLQSLSIEYKLFNREGVPLRGVLKTRFREFTEEDLRKRKNNKSSPDLTHVRYVKEGDTLPLMTHRIYGDSRYYLEVARANEIIHFRNLETGQKIIFPPIKKES